MTDLRTSFPVTSNKLLYIESSDEEDGPSGMINEKMDRTTVSLKHAHFLMPLEAIRSLIKKKSKIAKQLYVESSDKEDGPSAMINEKMDRTTISIQHVHLLCHWKTIVAIVKGP